MLVAALTQRGLGARTRSGYGLFQCPEPPTIERSVWVNETIARLRKQYKAKEDKADDILRGKNLAEAFQALEDLEGKREAFEDIRNRWQQKGWWEETPSGKSVKAARKIYDDYQSALEPASPAQSTEAQKP